MILYIITTLIITLMISLSFTPNPLIMGFSILLSALLLSTLFSLSMSSWYAFLIFLIYVGGMLVMFSYFVALSPNQQTMSLTHTTLIISLMIILMTCKPMMTMPMITSHFPQTDHLYKFSNSPMLIILALSLLFTMIVVVKVSSSSKGPLRAFSM